jgi:N-acetyl-anhydromuramyl-L-alanine amidase AmpD
MQHGRIRHVLRATPAVGYVLSRNRRRVGVMLVVALAAALAATGAAAETIKIGVLKSPNVTMANRTADHVDRIVVHTTEGSFWGSIRWLRNPRSRGSAHFVVSQQGEIVQLVSTRQVAWHAGNRRTNVRSIGIEHEGWAFRKGTLTDAQYDASARLTAYLVRRFGIPIDREHIIGHNEVPHPFDPTKRGGRNQHQDPGPHWRWGHYMELVRQYSEDGPMPQFVRVTDPGDKPPPPPPPDPPPPAPAPLPAAEEEEELAEVPMLAVVAGPGSAEAPAPRPVPEQDVRCGFLPSVHSATIYHGQTVEGLVPWRAHTCGRRLSRVDFLLDGKLLWTARRKPFVFARGRPLNTAAYANGWHTLTLRAHGRSGTVERRLRVRFENRPFRIETSGIAPEQAVSGDVRLHVRPNVPAGRVTLRVGDEVVESGSGRLRRFRVDTTALPNGRHELKLWAEAEDGRQEQKVVPILVANPQEVSEGSPRILWQSLSPLQTLDGEVAWHAVVEGEIEQVEFWIDGRLRWTADSEPFVFGGGDGRWDPALGNPGPRNLLLRAIGSDGTVAESRKLVFVAPAEAGAMAVPGAEGATEG